MLISLAPQRTQVDGILANDINISTKKFGWYYQTQRQLEHPLQKAWNLTMRNNVIDNQNVNLARPYYGQLIPIHRRL